MKIRTVLSFLMGSFLFLAASSPALAQTPSPVAPIPNTTPGISRTCDPNGQVLANTPSGGGCTGSVDILPYVAPNCGTGKSCAKTSSSAFPAGVSHAGDVSNSVTWIDATHFIQESNANKITYEVKGGKIRQIQDTTWINSETCTNGNPAFQKNYDSNGAPGMAVFDQNMTCGKPVEINGRVDAYDYTTGLACENSKGHAGDFSSASQLIYSGTAICNGVENVPMIAMQMVGAAAGGEVFVYCNKPGDGGAQGLCAWYERLDYSNPKMDPANWTTATDVCNLGSSSSGTLMCVVPIEKQGDIVAAAVKMSQVESIFGLTTDFLKGTILDFSETLAWLGAVKPLNTFSNSSPLLEAIGNQYLASADELDNAVRLEKQIDAKAQPISATARECIPNPGIDPYDLIGSFVSTTHWVTAPIRYLATLGQGGRKLGSFVTGYVQKNTDYSRPDIVVKTSEPLGCSPARKATVRLSNASGFTGQNTFGSPSKGDNGIFTVLGASTDTADVLGDTTTKCNPNNTNYVSCTFRAKSYELKPETDENGAVTGYTASVKVVGEREITTLTPWAHDSLCHVAGCKAGELTPIKYISGGEKKNLEEDGSVVGSMFRNDTFDEEYKTPILHAQKSGEEQKYVNILNEITDTNAGAPTANFLAARTEAGGVFGNCSLLPSSLQSQYLPSGECTTDWSSLSTSTGLSDGTANCNTSVASQAVAGLDLAGGKRYADTVYGSCTNPNAWDTCRNDVVAQAKKACVDPLFALAIWLHESGASNYVCGQQHSGGPVEDFGYHVAGTEENFQTQITSFLPLTDVYGNRCPHTLQDWVANYYLGPVCYNNLKSATDKSKVDGYIDDLRFVYRTIAPGAQLPTWPKIPGCGGFSG